MILSFNFKYTPCTKYRLIEPSNAQTLNNFLDIRKTCLSNPILLVARNTAKLHIIQGFKSVL